MITLCTRLFIKDYHNTSDTKVRKAYGVLCSIIGILFNVFLFALKYIASTITGSIAILADAFNNLSDAGSSFITLLGFKFAGKQPDLEHPFGHGRFEYVSGFVVSIMIILMGYELFINSVKKIITPEPVEISNTAIFILIVSICVKIYMFLYNRRFGKKIQSLAMKATAMDSLSDCIATTLVLINMIILAFANVNIDAYVGVFVALFILYAGIKTASETISPLLGQAPSKEYVKQIEDIVKAHEEIVGIHDLAVHDYGPGMMMVSLHGEVSGDSDIYEIHDVIDRIEAELFDKLGCEAVIHMDPIAIDDKAVQEKRAKVEELMRTIDERITIHDFRMVQGPTHTNLIFDAVIPHKFKMNDEDVKTLIQELIWKTWEHHFVVVKIDKSYI